MRGIVTAALGLAGLVMVGSGATAAQRKPARPVVKAKPAPARATSDDRPTTTLGPTAPFARIMIDIVPDACGSLGCEMQIIGVDRAGRRTDLTAKDLLQNGMLGTKAEVFGPIDANGMPLVTLDQGLINGGPSFNLYAYDPAARRYVFKKRVSGYGVYGSMQPSTTAARPVGLRVAPDLPGFPDRIEYMGYEGNIWNRMTIGHAAGLLVGSDYIEMGIFRGDVPISGTYANGECSITRKSDTFRGPCDANGFTGRIYNKKGKPGDSFEFLSRAEVERRKAGRAAASTGATPSPVQTTQAPALHGVWSLGRVRILTERGNTCGDASLGKPYCFDRAIDWLNRRPNKTEIDVVAMDQSWMPGSMIPYNGGQGWSIYRIARRGDGFTADTQRHFAVKTRVPQGCMYRGVQKEAWYVTVAGGRKVAVEATQYLCEVWRGEPIHAATIDYGSADADRLDYVGEARNYGQGAARARTASPADSGEDLGMPYTPTCYSCYLMERTPAATPARRKR